MNIYTFEITETLQRTVIYQAKTEEEAYRKMKEDYYSEKIVLDASDMTETEFSIIRGKVKGNEMKTIQELKNQAPVYLHNWRCKEDVLNDFQISDKNTDDINILFASYGDDNYSGDAWVLFEQDGRLYEVNGSHCSCYGLENQWEPEEVGLRDIEYRLTKGSFGTYDWCGNEFKSELIEFLGVCVNHKEVKF